MVRRRRPGAEPVLVGCCAGLLLLAGCSGTPTTDPAAPASGSSPADSTPNGSAEATSSPSETGRTIDASAGPTLQPSETRAPVDHHVSLARLMRVEPDGGRPEILATEQGDGYTSHEVIYRAGDIRVSGVLARPDGEGPFPGVVLNHGYIEPSAYTTGQGLTRERIALAQAGFVVLHTDYRGHAASDPAGPVQQAVRLGYIMDAVHAVDALKKLRYVDDDRLGMLGRSMGGGVTMGALVTHPGLVDAAVTYASVSSTYLENLHHFGDDDPEEIQQIYDRWGRPQESPRFYRGLSPRTYFDRITEPVLSHHGRADDTCPPRWARATQRAMRRAGVDSELRWYPGAGHTFYDQWKGSMEYTIEFLRQRLGR